MVSDDRRAPTEPESEHTSVEPKEAALEQATEPEFPQDNEVQGKEEVRFLPNDSRDSKALIFTTLAG